MTAACISAAVVTSVLRTWRGVSRATGPATRVTSAPASAAARATANPILPLDRLVRPRTGSIGSNVGPAVTRTRLPASSFGWKNAISSASSSSGSSIRPSPNSPHAWSPLPGPRTVAPSAASCAKLRCVAGCAHISRFIAGATSSGQRSIGRARQSSDSRSDASAVQEPGDEVGAGRRDQHGIGFAREVDVRHVVGLARVPLARVDGAVRERLQRHCGDEVLGGLGHHDLHGRSRLDHRARQLGRLVAGDAARQAEHDVAARQFGGVGRCRGIHGGEQRLSAPRRTPRSARELGVGCDLAEHAGSPRS